MKEVCDGKPVLEDPLFPRSVAEVEMQLMAIEMSTLRPRGGEGGRRTRRRVFDTQDQGHRDSPGDHSPLRKVIGPYALPFLEEEMQLTTKASSCTPTTAHRWPAITQHA